MNQTNFFNTDSSTIPFADRPATGTTSQSGLNKVEKSLQRLENDISLMSPNTLVRLIGGSAILIILKVFGVTWVPLLVIVLIIINLMTCNNLTKKWFPRFFACNEYLYNNGPYAVDNIVTVFLYCLFLLLFGSLFDTVTRMVLLILVIIRAFFVGIYYLTGKPNAWLKYLDVIEPVLIAYCIHDTFHTNNETYWALIIFCIFLKIMLVVSLNKTVNLNS